ncbi:MAG: 1-(5-phosphoribosyl)-5-((5-phosphoribosylamino)methylideneamino)imidazole-4-carboxamide isomerase [Thermoplasmata archaeon]
MKVYPAIDLMDGRVVRLFKGEKKTKKVYGDPIDIAHEFSQTVDKIHIVDLDGAFAGTPQNLFVVEKIISETGLKVQMGGGFRDYESIERAYSAGVNNVIIGTRAFDRDFLSRITQEFSGVTVSLDCRNGKIALSGWEEDIDIPLEEAYERVRNHVDRMIYTDIERDGTLEGTSLDSKFWNDEEMIYAGGVSTLDDVKTLKKVGFSGIIIGKAIYEGKIELKEVLANLGD